MHFLKPYPFTSTNDIPQHLHLPQGDALHFFYPLEMLFKEVYMRTSKIGRFRSADNAPHLLDIAALTEDDKDLFYPLAQSAMANVFDHVRLLARTHTCCYLFDEGHPIIKMKVQTSATIVLGRDNTPISYDRTFYFPIDTENSVFNFDEYNYAIMYTITFNTYIKNINTGTIYTYPHRETHTLRLTEPIGNMPPLETITYQLASATPYMSAETLWIEDDPDTYGNNQCPIEIVSITQALKEPTHICAGDWVEYTTDDNCQHYYIAKRETDTNAYIYDKTIFDFQPVDFRHSIHYVLTQDYALNPNIWESLDVAIRECLIYDIMQQWFLTAYPDEVEKITALLNRATDNLTKRLHAYRTNVGRVIPRQY